MQKAYGTWVYNMSMTIFSRMYQYYRKYTYKIWVGVFVLIASVEVASHLLFGNFAQSALVQRHEDPELCMVVGANKRLEYTGWYRKMPPTIMESNAFGSRENRDNFGNKINKKQVFIEKQLKVFMLGDSFTYGQGVQESDSLPHKVDGYLQENFTNEVSFDIWNFGVPGRNFYQIPADIERLLLWKPNLILVNMFTNDYHEAPGTCMLSSMTDVLLPVMRVCHICRWGLIALRPDIQTLSPSEIEQNIQQTIRTIEGIAHQNDVEVYFVLLSESHSIAAHQPPLPNIHEIVADATTHVIDLSSTWDYVLRNSDTLEIPGEFHLNPRGNDIVAQAYATSLYRSYIRDHQDQNHKEREKRQK